MGMIEARREQTTRTVAFLSELRGNPAYVAHAKLIELAMQVIVFYFYSLVSNYSKGIPYSW